MDEKTRELIAVAAAYSAGCIPGLENHIASAKTLGMTAAELEDVIAIGRAEKLQAFTQMDEVAKEVVSSPELLEVRILSIIHGEDQAMSIEFYNPLRHAVRRARTTTSST